MTETLGSIVTTFAYDDTGNRVTEVNNGVTTTNVYNAMNQLLTSTKPTEVITHTYDGRGNLKTQVSKTGVTTNYTNTFTYNTRNLLTNAAMGAASATYTFDHDGRRISETISGVTTSFVWDQTSQFGDVLLEQNSSGNTSYVYGGSQLLSQKKGAGVRNYLLGDAQGSTRLLLNNTSAVLQSYTYNAFGTLTTNPTLQTRYLFTGQQYDALSKFYSLRARTYSPNLGRFLSQDTYPIDYQNPMEWNRYVYTANNPLRWSDPSGLNSKEYTLTSSVALGVFVGGSAAVLLAPQISQTLEVIYWGIGDLLDPETLEAIKEALKLYLSQTLAGDIAVAWPIGRSKDDPIKPKIPNIALGLEGETTFLGSPISTLAAFTIQLNLRLNKANIFVYPYWGAYSNVKDVDFYFNIEGWKDAELTNEIPTQNNMDALFGPLVETIPLIHFNLEGMLPDALGAAMLGGLTFSEGKRITDTELRYILRHPHICAKTLFYEMGSILPIPNLSLNAQLCGKVG